MMLTGRKILTYILLFTLPGVFSCQETQDFESRGGMVSITDNALQQLKVLKPLPDGGFVVGVNSLRNGDWDMRVLRYDRSMNLLWERTFRSPGDDDLQFTHVSDNGQILVCGITIKENQVTWSKVRPYFHLLTDDGATLWEVNPDLYSDGNIPKGQLITDVMQLNNGDYRVASRFEAVHQVALPNTYNGYAVLFELNKDGQLGNIQITQADYMEAIFPLTSSSMAIFFTDADDLSELGYYEFNPDFSTGTEGYILKTSVPWSSGSFLGNNRELGLTKFTHNEELLSFNIAFPDHVMNYRYDVDSKEMSMNRYDLAIGNLHRLITVDDHTALISTEEGKLIVINDRFEVLKTFDIEWIGDLMCSTTDGDYLIASQTLNNINVLNLSNNGEWKEND